MCVCERKREREREREKEREREEKEEEREKRNKKTRDIRKTTASYGFVFLWCIKVLEFLFSNNEKEIREIIL